MTRNKWMLRSTWEIRLSSELMKWESTLLIFTNMELTVVREGCKDQNSGITLFFSILNPYSMFSPDWSLLVWLPTSQGRSLVLRLQGLRAGEVPALLSFPFCISFPFRSHWLLSQSASSSSCTRRGHPAFVLFQIRWNLSSSTSSFFLFS